MATFALTRVRGPAWDPALPMREHPGWDAHAEFMDALAAEGFIVFGGPLGEGDRRFHFAVEAASEHEILARLADDPWTKADMLVVERIDPWQILLRSGDR